MDLCKEQVQAIFISIDLKEEERIIELLKWSGHLRTQTIKQKRKGEKRKFE